jgi:transposase
MAKKSFKSGLDNLLASAGIKKKNVSEEEIPVEKKKDSGKKKEVNEDEKYWLLIKTERLEEELALWRNGKLSVDGFNESLKKHGLKYKPETNEIIER